MARREREIPGDAETAEIDMSPMIDMVFLLIIFFIVNANAITVKPDKNVRVPVASDASDIKSANGSIVVNVYNEETAEQTGAKWGDDEGKPLRDREELTRYISDMAKRFAHYKDDPGLTLYLRGDQDALYKSSREVIEVAAGNEVGKIMFATHLK